MPSVVCRRPVATPAPIGGDEQAVTWSGSMPRNIGGGWPARRVGQPPADRVDRRDDHGHEPLAELRLEHGGRDLQRRARRQAGVEVGAEAVADERGDGDHVAAMAARRRRR